MSLLTGYDTDRYAQLPSGASKHLALNRALALLEGPQGANRPLGITESTEVLTVLNRQLVRLSYLPVLPDLGISVQVQFGGRKEFNRLIPLSDWAALSADDYTFDAQEGVVYLDRLPLGTSDFQRQGRMQYNAPTRCRVTYSSGIDFSGDSAEAERLRYLVGQLAELQSSQAYQGVQSYTQDRVYSVSYGSGSGRGSAGQRGGPTGQAIQDILNSVHQYRPRQLTGIF